MQPFFIAKNKIVAFTERTPGHPDTRTPLQASIRILYAQATTLSSTESPNVAR